MKFWPDTQDVQESKLQLGEELGRGGEGRVVRVLGQPTPIVFKQYIVAGADSGALKTLVDLPASLPPAERERLLQLSAWPLARVVRGDKLSGFLMREIPGHFFATGRARELLYLLYQRKPSRGDIVPGHVSVTTRLEVAGECARLIHLLHSRSLVIGDLSARNVLWAPGDPASIFIIDCDGIRQLGSRPVLPQAQTVDWDDPQQPASGPDLDTDRYRLALLVGRVLCATSALRPGEELRLVPGVPGRAAVKVRELWAQAARPHGNRPEARYWMTALEGREEMLLEPPSSHWSGSAPVRSVVEDLGAGLGNFMARPTVPSTSVSPSRIFVSYRRDDAAWPVNSLFMELVTRLGADRVWRDVDSIQPGDDFSEAITAAVTSCAVLLAVIGDNWLTTTDREGRRRLDDPEDFVRLEIEAALTRNVRVIPILVGAAPMPRSDQLPPNLKNLARRQALQLRPDHFKADIDPLLRMLDKVLSEVGTRPVDQ